MASPGRSLRFARLRPLTACLATVLGLGCAQAAPSHTASAIVVVTNCNDNGPGSLRDAVAGAIDGDMIDLSQLGCSRISLVTGSIRLMTNLTLFGLDAALLTIDGQDASRIFYQLYPDISFSLYDMTLTRGSSDSMGGCVYAAGSVQLVDVVVSSCRVAGSATQGNVKGGGLFVGQNLSMVGSTITRNEAYSTFARASGGGVYVSGTLYANGSSISTNAVAAEYPASGGGIFARGRLVTEHATIADNLAYGLGGPYSGSGGGGAVSYGPVQIVDTTISGNTAETVGGLLIFTSSTTQSKIINSTISGNAATTRYTGGVSSTTSVLLANSTIAFNTEAISLGAGFYSTLESPLDLESSIIANNGGGLSPVDLGGLDSAIAGSNNLVLLSGTMPVPPDTLHVDPQLLPLTDNGGATLTHALRSTSPTIDAGNNPLNLKSDQREAGFPRVIGAHADIGAFEFDPDWIFANGFQ